MHDNHNLFGKINENRSTHVNPLLILVLFNMPEDPCVDDHMIFHIVIRHPDAPISNLIKPI